MSVGNIRLEADAVTAGTLVRGSVSDAQAASVHLVRLERWPHGSTTTTLSSAPIVAGSFGLSVPQHALDIDHVVANARHEIRTDGATAVPVRIQGGSGPAAEDRVSALSSALTRAKRSHSVPEWILLVAFGLMGIGFVIFAVLLMTTNPTDLEPGQARTSGLFALGIGLIMILPVPLTYLRQRPRPLASVLLDVPDHVTAGDNLEVDVTVNGNRPVAVGLVCEAIGIRIMRVNNASQAAPMERTLVDRWQTVAPGQHRVSFDTRSIVPSYDGGLFQVVNHVEARRAGHERRRRTCFTKVRHMVIVLDA